VARFNQVEKPFKWTSLIFFIVALILVILVARGVWRVYNQSRFANDNYLSTKEQLDSLQTRQKQITDRLASLSTTRGLEEEVRNDFSVVRPGEQMILIVDSASTSSTTATTSPTGLWGTLKNLLFGGS
jgi:cell division protein FtsB